MVNPIIPLIIGFVLFIIVDSAGPRGPLFSQFGIMFYFLFIYSNLREQSFLATFYLILALASLVMYAVKLSEISNSQNLKIGSINIKGFFNVNIVGVLLGLAMFAIMWTLSNRTGTTIIGTPNLAISSASFSALTAAYLGIIENRGFFTLFDVLTRLPIQALQFLGLFIPLLVAIFSFAIFHLFAFSLSISNLTFAAIVMGIWLSIYMALKDDSMANTTHYWWNGIINVAKQVRIV